MFYFVGPVLQSIELERMVFTAIIFYLPLCSPTVSACLFTCLVMLYIQSLSANRFQQQQKNNNRRVIFGTFGEWNNCVVIIMRQTKPSCFSEDSLEFIQPWYYIYLIRVYSIYQILYPHQSILLASMH